VVSSIRSFRRDFGIDIYRFSISYRRRSSVFNYHFVRVCDKVERFMYSNFVVFAIIFAWPLLFCLKSLLTSEITSSKKNKRFLFLGIAKIHTANTSVAYSVLHSLMLRRLGTPKGTPAAKTKESWT